MNDALRRRWIEEYDLIMKDSANISKYSFIKNDTLHIELPDELLIVEAVGRDVLMANAMRSSSRITPLLHPQRIMNRILDLIKFNETQYTGPVKPSESLVPYKP